MTRDLLDPELKASLLVPHEAPRAVPGPTPPPSLLALSKAVQSVSTAAGAARMADDLARVDVGFVGIDVEFRYGDIDDPDDDHKWQDPRELKPLLLGLSAMVRDRRQEGLVPARYAVDVRRAETHAGLAEVLRRPYTFVAHHIKSELFALSALGFPWPRAIFCTWLAAQLLDLGRHHARYIDPSPVDEIGEERAEHEARRNRKGATSLQAQLNRYRVVYPFGGDKAEMQQRYLRLADDAPFTSTDYEYVTADAFGAAALYLPQTLALAEAGLAHHYATLELPSAVALMDIEWNGVTVDRAKIELAREAATRATLAYEERLKSYGFRVDVATPAQRAAGAPAERVMVASHNERAKVLGDLGLLHLFATKRGAGGYSFRKELLKQHQDAHPVVRLLYLHGKYTSITRERLFQGEFTSADGRVRPSVNPLGADSGRMSFRRPNIVGIGKVLRPIVVPDGPGYELAEFDFAAQEVFIAAAHFNDPVLLADCNKGDPYIEMIRHFCPDDLEPGDELLDDAELAARLGPEKFKARRGTMKTLMLATIYGVGDTSIAAQLGTTPAGAKRLRKRFFARYTALAEGIRRAHQQLRDRGHTTTATGLRRYRGKKGGLSNWEKNWAVNGPIQGGGACILKLLLPRVAAFLRRHGGRIVLPIFDAVLVQYPREARAAVLAGVPELMIEAMRELYPATRPRVDTTADAPHCWNKSDRADSIERFLADPEYKP